MNLAIRLGFLLTFAVASNFLTLDIIAGVATSQPAPNPNDKNYAEQLTGAINNFNRLDNNGGAELRKRVIKIMETNTNTNLASQLTAEQLKLYDEWVDAGNTVDRILTEIDGLSEADKKIIAGLVTVTQNPGFPKN